MSWELSHYPILASHSVVIIDEWWDGSRDWLCCKKQALRVWCLQGPCKKGSYIVCWDELSGSHPNVWQLQILPIVLDIHLKHVLDTEEVLFYVMYSKLVSGCGGFFLKVNKQPEIYPSHYRIEGNKFTREMKPEHQKWDLGPQNRKQRDRVCCGDRHLFQQWQQGHQRETCGGWPERLTMPPPHQNL